MHFIDVGDRIHISFTASKQAFCGVALRAKQKKSLFFALFSTLFWGRVTEVWGLKRHSLGLTMALEGSGKLLYGNTI